MKGIFSIRFLRLDRIEIVQAFFFRGGLTTAYFRDEGILHACNDFFTLVWITGERTSRVSNLIDVGIGSQIYDFEFLSFMSVSDIGGKGVSVLMHGMTLSCIITLRLSEWFLLSPLKHVQNYCQVFFQLKRLVLNLYFRCL